MILDLSYFKYHLYCGSLTGYHTIRCKSLDFIDPNPRSPNQTKYQKRHQYA